MPFGRFVLRAYFAAGYLLLSTKATLEFFRLKPDELGPTLAALTALVTVRGLLLLDRPLSCCENLYG